MWEVAKPKTLIELNNEYNFWIKSVEGKIFRLITSDGPITKKELARLNEFRNRRDNISNVWMNTTGKSLKEREEKLTEIVEMLQELDQDLKKFSNKV